ncbi:Planctomycete cytochrome C [Aquisphaera giovannonii]|uniref:Planctomycete cytochrome C n=1 Tax=Aquisphaera giovannonii TaxID=406548 RepID=A0A5B9W2X1_9BACT|nr:PSD1 and planctomycete cytochrome C domain-containing protein [Aquisphaera giovannonii]QEH34431.1 Planctomycete cytochrome C [Aquisphaera giovannonii]
MKRSLSRKGPVGRVAATCSVLGLMLAAARAEEVPSLGRQVMPLLTSRCVKCHGPAVQKNGLNLATPRGLARGGKDGSPVVAGRPDESPLWEAVSTDAMPPKEPLSPDEKAVLRRWIEAGAPGLPKVSPGDAPGSDHWAFAPASRPEPPAVRDARRVRNPVDRFLEAALEARGLALAPEADRATLVRRVALDLTGLPPSPGEISAYIRDPAPDAYERMVGRYLASPRYAARWGKLWLDAAGYADSNGYFNADTDRPLAYRYRDYVIRCWAEDRPLDRFIREQIAGDELVGYHPGGPATRPMVESLIATHFLRNAPDGTGESDGNPDELTADRYAVLEGATQVIGSSMLGLSLQCARCHDHKFEPVSQRDYYALYAILAPAYNVRDWVKPADRSIAGEPEPHELAAWEESTRAIDAEIIDLKTRAAFRDPFVTPDARRKKALDEAVKDAEGRRLPRPGRISFIMEPAGTAPAVHVLKRGQYGDHGPEVAPAPPSVLADPDNPYDPARTPGGTSGRRLAFARWLTRPGSRPAALLARVIANRIWQGHFGAGLVATPENLGYSGSAPSHPELLEFLASELARSGWSAKALHRLILNSAAYRQSSRPDERTAEVDPDNRLLGRFPLRRLDAETIRDAMLAVSGELDEPAGGPYVPTSPNDQGEVLVDEKAEGAHRRSVFLQQRRTQVLSFLDVFDAPSIVTNCTRRSSTTMPLQSLSLLNSDFVAARARAFAGRLRREAGEGPEARVQLAFLLVAGRPPTGEERAAASRFLADQPARYAGRPDAAESAWADFAQMLLGSNAFLYED